MKTRPTARRNGAVMVEVVFVLGIFLMVLFGIFEYSRYLYVLHMVNNAARDGARYAVVNTDKPSTFDTTDYTDPSGRVYPAIQRYTVAALAGAEVQRPRSRWPCTRSTRPGWP